MRKTTKKPKRQQAARHRQFVTLPDPLPPLLTRPELCSLVRLSYVSIWKMTKAGKFPLARNVAPGTGQALRWDTKEVQDWLSRRPRAGSIARHGPPADGGRSQAAR